MKTYQSHKVVQAAKIRGYQLPDKQNIASMGMAFEFDGTDERIGVDWDWLKRHADNLTTLDDIGRKLTGGYYVIYPDGFTSWSPAKSFEEGYTEPSLDPKDGALPVAGYKPQTDGKVTTVNGFKADEERILRKLDELRGAPADEVDQRWLAIGRTGLETAMMAINRSIFQPGRISLPEDVGQPQ